MLDESITSFFNRYHRYPSRQERVVTPAFNLDYTPLPKHEEESADITIWLPEFKREWRVHRDVITGQSNFFRMALAVPLLESRTKEIELYEIDATIMNFIVVFMYEDWSSAATSAFGLEGGGDVPPPIIAEILIAADFLDIPRLCYAAYHMMLSGIVSLVMRTKAETTRSRVFDLAKQAFCIAAITLEISGTKVGLDLAEAIQKFLEKTRRAQDLDRAAEAFVEAFPNDRAIIDLELQW
ncbi:hypothetical protein GL218_07269 [Daldinia childiae]|uniref:uncharacterized protein n=1 Tax=Daldinia childiae TaxID=326645 RepID=UPI001446B118|nr:uncharacterized protein GL218_07269 [Daldinia childiae]KAF3055983.1 hypothetical protein GL218_07269 [Daldinia childiae]